MKNPPKIELHTYMNKPNNHTYAYLLIQLEGTETLAVSICLSYFSIFVKRHHDQDNLQKKEFKVIGEWNSSFKGSESMSLTAGSIKASRQA